MLDNNVLDKWIGLPEADQTTILSKVDIHYTNDIKNEWGKKAGAKEFPLKNYGIEIPPIGIAFPMILGVNGFGSEEDHQRIDNIIGNGSREKHFIDGRHAASAAANDCILISEDSIFSKESKKHVVETMKFDEFKSKFLEEG